MHEYSLVQALLGQIEDLMRSRDATGVHRVRLKLGELAGVDPELLATAIETFKPGTVLERAELQVVQVAARWECGACQRPIARGEKLQCGECGAPGRLVEGGDLLLDQLELEVP